MYCKTKHNNMLNKNPWILYLDTFLLYIQTTAINLIKGEPKEKMSCTLNICLKKVISVCVLNLRKHIEVISTGTHLEY